jgi:hypothetical protein
VTGPSGPVFGGQPAGALGGHLRRSRNLLERQSPRNRGDFGLAEVADAGSRHVVLIDDAEALDDPAGAVDALLQRLVPDVHVFAAGRADLLRSTYGHWTQTVRRSGTGVLLALLYLAKPRHARPLILSLVR